MAVAELYMLTFASGRHYVGITKTGYRNRYRRHQLAATNGKSNVVYKAWRKHGDPEAKVIAIGSVEYIAELEPKAIAAFRTRFPHGYNMAHGGEIPPSKAAIVGRKISAAKKGKPISQATIDSVKRANTGKKHSAATIAKLTPLRRRPCKEETKRKISEAQKGKPRPPESIRKMAAALRGRVMPEEVRRKISEAHKGKKMPEGALARAWATRRARMQEQG